MALNESATFLVSMILAVLTFSSMQVLRPTLVSTQLMTILGGFIGSIFFVLTLTGLANLEKVIFGKGFAAKWFEVILSLVATVFASASVHRVSATTSLLFSLMWLYSMAKISQEEYPSAPVVVSSHSGGLDKSKKKK